MPGPTILINDHAHTLGQALRVARKQSGMTLCELAALSGYGVALISRWERDLVGVKAYIWLELMTACGWQMEARKNVSSARQSAAGAETYERRTVTQSTGDAAA